MRALNIPAAMSRKAWIEETFSKRECVKFISSSRNPHRCVPVCQVCQNLIRCCCGRLMAEHSWQESLPPVSICHGSGEDVEEDWSIELHTKASSTDAFGTIDFEDTATRVCRAKYVRVAVDSKSEWILQLMIKEWQMERPKLLITVQGGLENFNLPPKVKQAFCKGLMTAAVSTGAWILTDGVNTGVSKYVGEAVKTFGSHDLRKRNTVGITPWGVIDNHTDLIGRDVFRPYQPLGNPLSKRACLNSFHSHFLLVDDGTLGKHGCQQDLRRRLERLIQQQKIHPRLNQGVPAVCVVLEGGPAVVSTVLDYVSSVPPIPVFVFEGSGRAADLLAFLHKLTAAERHLDADIKEDFRVRIRAVFGVNAAEASHLYSLLLKCMDHRQSITIFDSESEEHVAADASILTSALKGTDTSPAEQLGTTLAWDRADIAQDHVLLYGQHWKAGSLEQVLLDALVMDRVSFVKLLIDNGMTMNRFLTVFRLEELYNTPSGQSHHFLHHLVEDVKQTSLLPSYRLTIIDIGLVIEYLIGGAYCSTYTRKQFRAAYGRLMGKGRRNNSPRLSNSSGFLLNSEQGRKFKHQHFCRTAQPYKQKDQETAPGKRQAFDSSPGFVEAPLLVPFNFNDLFVWAVLQQRQQMALFLWKHGEEALARATVACKLYRSMAFEARQSSLDDNIVERFRSYSREFGQLAVDVLDCAFRQNEQMAMKLLTSEMEAWSHFTCLQMAVSSNNRALVSHSCTQTLLNDLWTGPLNMRKNCFPKIILSLLLPPASLLLEFKSKAEMSHVPQSHEALLFGHDLPKSPAVNEEKDHMGSHGTEHGCICPSLHDRCPNCLSETVTSVADCFFSGMTKIYGVYTAPVVKFWFHTISYLVFLVLFSYTILVKMGDKPSIPEWLVIVYILTTAVEKTREVAMSEPRKLKHKLRIWFSEYWNRSDLFAIVLFLAGLVLRWHAEPFHTAGRICYCLDIIFWFVRMLDLLAVNQHAGPYLTMITKMTSSMFFIVVMLAIVLLAYGVSRKAILSPDEGPSWALARDVVFQPYWMIFGEVYAAEMNRHEDGQPHPPTFFLIPLLQAVYMFVQYIIMVNILIAFFNNIYFDMASTSNKLWKYNRYRFIMTYQDRPWLPPPLILLSHMTLGLRAIYRRLRGQTGCEENRTGLKLYLSHDDRKKLHEFEEKCVHEFFYGSHDSQQCNQKNRVRITAERTEEMSLMVGEVTERVSAIQDSLSELDCQLGKLQDLSVSAVDTVTLLSASDIRSSQHVLPHSWSLQHSDEPNVRILMAQKCKSTPPSLLKGNLLSSRWVLQEGHVVGRMREEILERKKSQFSDGFRSLERRPALSKSTLSQFSGRGYRSSDLLDQKLSESYGPSRCGSSLSNKTGDRLVLHLQPSLEDTSMEEEEFQDVDIDDSRSEVETLEKVLSLPSTRTNNKPLSEHEDLCLGLVNPGFSLDGSKPSNLEKFPKSSRVMLRPKDRFYGHCRSLSASVENMTLSGERRESSPHVDKQRGGNGHAMTLGEDDSLQCSSRRDWSKSLDLSQVLGSRKAIHPRKTVKIQGISHLSDTSWRRRQRLEGKATCWSASASLSQLNFEPMDDALRLRSSHQEVWSPNPSAWNSWARPVSPRSFLPSGVAFEAPKSRMFQSSEDLYPHYSAMERNNLMRLAHSIPFTPVSPMGGEEVSVYTLMERPSATVSGSPVVSSWSSQGLSAVLQPLPSEEGSLDGGLRQGCRVLCTWAESSVLRPGLVYVVKAFRPEVVDVWQKYFHGSTALQLCLREIQQQRAAQKMMHVFNQMKPAEVHFSPRFLDVSLVLWQSNGQWLTIERELPGRFRKYNNNTGEEIRPECFLEELLLAFSHWTYEYSGREMLVLDLQGVADELTDPTVVMATDQRRGEMLFGPDNLGEAAIHGFLRKHVCNSVCDRLGLSGRPLDQRVGSGDAASDEEEYESHNL
ncbi:transient receptor potential cation channel subfamily M member 6 [Neosynchiropus ocellatus]